MSRDARERLKRLMEEHGDVSVAELARRSGVSRESISKISNDKRGLGSGVGEKLAAALGVTLDELLLPRAEEVDSRRGLDRRLREAEGEIRLLNERLARLTGVLRTAGLVPPEAEGPARSGDVSQ